MGRKKYRPVTHAKLNFFKIIDTDLFRMQKKSYFFTLLWLKAEKKYFFPIIKRPAAKSGFFSPAFQAEKNETMFDGV